MIFEIFISLIMFFYLFISIKKLIFSFNVQKYKFIFKKPNIFLFFLFYDKNSNFADKKI